MKTSKNLIYACLFVLLLPLPAVANNIQITTKPKLINTEAHNGRGDITFDISWDNSWRTNRPNNWDAAWVFVKYRDGGGDWQHMYLDTAASAHNIGTDVNSVGAVIKPGTSNILQEDGSYAKKAVGVFIYRGKNGQGAVKLTGVKLQWKYADQGVDEGALLSLRVFGIEMVYVPDGEFYAGDGSQTRNVVTYASNSDFYQYPSQGTTSIPVNLSNLTSPITKIGDGSSNLLTMKDNNDSVIFLGYQTGAGTATNPCTNGAYAGSSTGSNYGVGNYRSFWPSSSTAGVANYTSNSSYTLATNTGVNVTVTASVAYNDGWIYYTTQYPFYEQNYWAVNGYSTNAAGYQRLFCEQYAFSPRFKANEFSLYYMSNNTSYTGSVNILYVTASNDLTNWDTLWGTRTPDVYSQSSNTSARYAFTGTPKYYGYYRVWVGNKVLIATGTSSYSLISFTAGFWNSNGLCGNFEGDQDRLNAQLDKAMNERNAAYYAPYQGYFKITAQNCNRLQYAGNTATAPVGSKLADGFPTGYKGFYIMKYEVSQHAYVDFLNTLTYTQQYKMTPTAIKPNVTVITGDAARFVQGTRNYVRVRTPMSPTQPEAIYGNNVEGTSQASPWDYENQGGNLAMNGLLWFNIASYLDWSGLRPLTELEYEKSCRGPIKPAPLEYAWGNDQAISIVNVVPQNANMANEMPPVATPAYNAASFSAVTNANYPYRVGFFAPAEGTTRESAGAGYWGIYNLTDNVAERYVNISTAQGRAFTGEHGDGMLRANGLHNVLNWPDETAAGTGFKGVARINAATGIYGVGVSATVSARVYSEVAGESVVDTYPTGANVQGIRGGRTAE